MNGKQLGLLILLLAVIGGGFLLVRRGHDASAGSGEAGAGKKLLGDKFELNDVAHIAIRQDTNVVDLVKKEVWSVRERDDYPANYSRIVEFLTKAAELKVVQTEEVGASQLPRLQLAAAGTNAGTVLDLLDKNDKLLKSLTLGKMHTRKALQNSQFGDEGFPDGRYVLLAGDTQNAFLIADPLNNAEPKPDQWINKDFIKVELPKAISVAFPAATNSWKLSRDTQSGEWKFADVKPGEEFDTNKIAGLTSPFASPAVEDVLPKAAKLGDHGLDTPTVVTVDTFEDFNYTLKVGKKEGENHPLTVAVTANFPRERPVGTNETAEVKASADKAWADRIKHLDEKLKQAKAFENWTFLVPSWNVDPILKERKDLFVEKKEEKPADKTAAAADMKDSAPPVEKPEDLAPKK